MKKLLIFNNPTGINYSSNQLIKISKIINKYNVITYSDELYNELVYTKGLKKSDSLCNYCPKLTIVRILFLKFMVGGWRCGWNTFQKN